MIAASVADDARSRAIGRVALAVGVAAMLVGPVLYTVDTMDKAISGGDPAPGPASGRFGGFPGGFPGGAGGFPGDAAGTDDALVAWLVAHHGEETWLVAVGSANQAGPLQLASGVPVMAMGGFMGSDPAPTLEQLQAYVRDGSLRYVLLGEGRGGGPGGFFGGDGRGSVSGERIGLGHVRVHAGRGAGRDALRLLRGRRFRLNRSGSSTGPASQRSLMGRIDAPAMSTAPITRPRPVPLPADMGDQTGRHRRPPRRQRRLHRPHVGPSRWPRRAGGTGRAVHGGRPADGPAGHLPRADRHRAGGPQPVAGPGLRARPPGAGPSLAGLRDGLADRRPPRPHADGLGHRRRAEPGHRARGPRHGLPVRAVGRRRVPPVPARGHLVDGGRPAPRLLRDLVLDPRLRLPRGRPRVPAPALRGRRLHPRPAGGDLLDLALRADGGAGARLPVRAAARPQPPPPAARRRRHARGPRRGLGVRRRSRPGAPGGPLRPVLRRPLPVPRAHGGGPIRTRCRRRPTAPGSGSPSRRWATTRPGSRISPSAPASSWRVRTGTSPAPAAHAPR